MLTIITAKNEPKDRLKAEQVQEVPGKTRDPSHVEITGHDTGLKHGLKANRKWKWQFYYFSTNVSFRSTLPGGELRFWWGKEHTDNKPGKESIDPAHDQRLRDHHHHVPLHHAHHGLHARWIRHGVCRRLAAAGGILEERAALIRRDEVVLAHLKGRPGQDRAGIVAQVHAAQEAKALARFGKRLGRSGRVVHQDCGIMAEDTRQDLY